MEGVEASLPSGIWDNAGGGVLKGGMYNGNISIMTTDNGKTLEGEDAFYGGSKLTSTYQYDQLHRIKGMYDYTGLGAGNYSAAYGYDGNGNLTSLRRLSKGAPMDVFRYSYALDEGGKLKNNRLYHIGDTVLSATHSGDIDNQDADNYRYDALGQLVGDAAEGITDISWTVDGKISRIGYDTATGRDSLYFFYDGMGNRILKLRKPIGWQTRTDWRSHTYARDARGNVLAMYDMRYVGGELLVEMAHPMYGSSRLGVHRGDNLRRASDGYGMYVEQKDRRSYELSDHLGNVRTTVSDRKVFSDSTYVAQVHTAQDYYPFGALMAGHAVLLASDITKGSIEVDGKTVETMSFYALSTSSDTDVGNYGGRTFTFQNVDGK